MDFMDNVTCRRKVVKDKCNTPNYTLVIFDMFRVFCKHNLTVS